MSINLNYVAWKNSLKGRTIRKLMGERAKYKKNIRARENEMKKIRARQLTLKNIHATG